MKNLNKIIVLTALGSLSGIQAAQATSTYQSNSNVTITINNITNNTNAGDLSGLDIYGLFEFDNESSYKIITGTGDSTQNLIGGELFSFDTASNADNSFSQNFSSFGQSINGHVESAYHSLGGVEFINISNDSFSIALSIDYSLESHVTGATARNSVAIEYGNILTDIDFIDWYSDDDSYEAISNTATPLADPDSFSSSASFTIDLNALESNLFYADVSINGYTKAVSAVPVPAAGWLLLSGLGFLGRFRSSAT